jgi:hypothetical protein
MKAPSGYVSTTSLANTDVKVEGGWNAARTAVSEDECDITTSTMLNHVAVSSSLT